MEHHYNKKLIIALINKLGENKDSTALIWKS